jgi:4a-hydroxytetrahydrobiopterin dehydratase
MKLTEERIAELLPTVPNWVREDAEDGNSGKWIVRKYRFREFMQAIEFVNAVAREAEGLNHHPFIAIDYKLVTLRMTSWHAGGLTELDFTAAAAFNAAYASYTMQ